MKRLFADGKQPNADSGLQANPALGVGIQIAVSLVE
jgi:hypothetical protein